MATGKGNGISRFVLGAAATLIAVAAVAGCSVQRPGAVADHSLDAIERQRAAMGIPPADTSYEEAERNRLTFAGSTDTSYGDLERYHSRSRGR
jgi:hypothetical protein